MRAITLNATFASLTVLMLAACGGDTQDAGDLNANLGTTPATGGTSGGSTTATPTTGSGGAVQPMPGVGGTPAATPTPTQPAPGAVATPASGGETPAAGVMPSDPVPDGPDPVDTSGPAPTTEMMDPGTPVPEDMPGGGGGAPGVDEPGEGGAANPDVPAGAGGMPAPDGAGGMPDDMPPDTVTGPYAPRTGSFNMLVYSRTAAFRHSDSINTGRQMLMDIASKQGFNVTFTEENNEITPDGLANYEIVFFLNSTGDIFNNNEQQVYEDWMTSDFGGAFAGTHSATDTENGWAFYSEVTGQYYDLHDACCAEAEIQWDPDALGFIAVQGLPNPWRRAEEWYKFDRASEWSTKAGFQILSRVTTNNNTRPVSYIREWGNFRSFYTSLGHEGPTMNDENVRKHISAGIMWAVRREAELVP